MYEKDLSIIIPVYNTLPYLEKCFNSIVSQTYHNWEAIVVDDGSSDGSGKFCDDFAKKDKRFKVIHKKNEGLVAARKTGIISAVGKYVTFVDSDDWIESHSYKSLMEMIDCSEADVIICGLVYEHHKKGNRKLLNAIAPGVYEGKKLEGLWKKMILMDKYYRPGILPALWNKIFKRSILLPSLMNVDNHITMGEDVACTYPTLLNAKKIVITELCFYHYCYRGQSMSRAFDSKYGVRATRLYEYLNNWTERTGRLDLQRQIGFHRLYILETGIMMILTPRNGLSLRKKQIEIIGLSKLRELRKGYKVVEKDFFNSNGLKGKLHYYIYKQKWRKVFVLALIMKVQNSL